MKGCVVSSNKELGIPQSTRIGRKSIEVKDMHNNNNNNSNNNNNNVDILVTTGLLSIMRRS